MESPAAPDNELSRALLRYLPAPMAYPDDAIVFVEGQQASGIWRVAAGRLRLLRTSQQGRHLNIRTAIDGELLGLSAAVGQSTYRMMAQAIGTCSLQFCDRTQLQRLMAEPEIARLVARALAEELQGSYGTFSDLILARNAEARIARVLITADLSIIQSHQQIGEIAACSRETVSRTMRSFQRQGFVRYERGGVIAVLNKGRLQCLADED